jgi:hypothetical protein
VRARGGGVTPAGQMQLGVDWVQLAGGHASPVAGRVASAPTRAPRRPARWPRARQRSLLKRNEKDLGAEVVGRLDSSWVG